MARTLTKKRRGFVNDYADTGNATKAVLNNYDTKEATVAQVIGSELLRKPIIQEELRKLGFDSNNAKRVVAEIMNDDNIEPASRLNAADKIFKVNSDYAPEKHVNLNIDAKPNERARELADRLLQLHG